MASSQGSGAPNPLSPLRPQTGPEGAEGLAGRGNPASSCCWLERLAPKRIPGGNYSAQGGFPHCPFVGQEEATREHVTAWEGQDTQESESPPHLVTEPQSVSCPWMWLSLAKYKLKCAFSSLLSGFQLDTSLKETRSKQSVDEMELGGSRRKKVTLHPLCPLPRSPFCRPVSLNAALQRQVGSSARNCDPRCVMPRSAAAVRLCLKSPWQSQRSRQSSLNKPALKGAQQCVVTWKFS